MIPTWDQYQSLRRRYPDTFLFFRWQTGYWLFHDQAFIAARVLYQQSLTAYCLLPGGGLVRVRSLPFCPERLSPIIAELKLLCFGMRSQVIDELPD